MAITKEGKLAREQSSKYEFDEREPVWANARDLAKYDIIFTIITIMKGEERWYLELDPNGFRNVPEEVADTLPFLNIDPDEQKVLLSLACTKTRDADLKGVQEIVARGPLGNCFISAEPMYRGGVYYDLNLLEKDSELYESFDKKKTKVEPHKKKDQSPPSTSKGRVKSKKGDEFNPFLEDDELP